MGKKKVGYIGLGHMGGGMAGNLLKQEFSVTVYDVNPDAVAILKDQGALTAGSPKAVAERADVVITSLPNPQIVMDVALGENGIVEGISTRKVYIDMSSIDPETTRKVGARIAETGARMLDVPVGKGPAAAASGNLTLMMGGDRGVIEECEEVLKVLGSDHFYCGELGMGVTTKVVNNLVSCSINALISEAMALGAAAGADPEILREVMMSTAADNSHLRAGMKSRTFQRDFSSNFKLSLAHKDLGLASQKAGVHGIPSILGSAALAAHTLAMGKELGDEDQTAIVKVWEDCTGVEVKGDSK